jgi:hypothetical protein
LKGINIKQNQLEQIFKETNVGKMSTATAVFHDFEYKCLRERLKPQIQTQQSLLEFLNI